MSCAYILQQVGNSIFTTSPQDGANQPWLLYGTGGTQLKKLFSVHLSSIPYGALLMGAGLTLNPKP